MVERGCARGASGGYHGRSAQWLRRENLADVSVGLHVGRTGKIDVCRDGKR